jgi:hypothetical protein
MAELIETYRAALLREVDVPGEGIRNAYMPDEQTLRGNVTGEQCRDQGPAVVRVIGVEDDAGTRRERGCRAGVEHTRLLESRLRFRKPEFADATGSPPGAGKANGEIVDESLRERIRWDRSDDAVEERAAKPAGALDGTNAGLACYARRTLDIGPHVDGGDLDNCPNTVRTGVGQIADYFRLAGDIEVGIAGRRAEGRPNVLVDERRACVCGSDVTFECLDPSGHRV